MGKIEIGVNILGVVGGKFKRITSFPTTITKDEKLIDKLDLKNSIKYVTLEINDDGELISKVINSISKKD